MKNIVFIVVASALLLSCKETKPAEENSTKILGPKADIPESLHPLYDSIMWWHDYEAMPRYEPVINAKILIKSHYDSVTAYSETDLALLSALTGAGDKMMDWMREFEQDYVGWEEDSIQGYLKDELARMKVINSEMKSAIEAAEARLNNQPDH